MTKFKIYKLYSKRAPKKRILLGWRKIRKKPLAIFTATMIAFHLGFVLGFVTVKLFNE